MMDSQIYIPINNMQHFLLPSHILASVTVIFFFPGDIPSGVRWNLKVTLTSLFLLYKDIEYFYTFFGHVYFLLKLYVQFICSFVDWIIWVLLCLNLDFLIYHRY